MRCDNCGSTDTYIKNHEHIYQIKGKEIKFNSDRRFCSKCNNLGSCTQKKTGYFFH